ncbi:hypothetical protein [Nocardia sp. NPDC049707]|uniref:hypothetical protein n=1 Tax=Nocardia sp. NPDC049707 TaxID=3154735 RepID=UPI0034194197
MVLPRLRLPRPGGVDLSVPHARLSPYLPAAREESDMAETDEQPTVRLVVHCRRCHGWLMSPESVARRVRRLCRTGGRAAP